MGQIWDFLIVQPFAWLLRTFYDLTGNYGFGILLFALAAKIVLLFFAFKGKRGMMKQQRLAPKVQELQKKYGTDKQKLQQAQAKLYQDEGVSMFGGCIWMFIPFPIIIALYGAVRQPMQYILQQSKEAIEQIASVLETLGVSLAANDPYYELRMAQELNLRFSEITSALPDLEGLRQINFNFLGMNLGDVPSFTGLIVLIPLISALTSFLSFWLTQKFSGIKQQGNMQMMSVLLGPGISLWLGFTLPAALGVYWIAQNLLTIPQEYFLTRHFRKVLDAEDAQKVALEERRKAAEALQKEEDRQRRAERIAQQNKKHKPKRYKLKPTSAEDQTPEE